MFHFAENPPHPTKSLDSMSDSTVREITVKCNPTDIRLGLFNRFVFFWLRGEINEDFTQEGQCICLYFTKVVGQLSSFSGSSFVSTWSNEMTAFEISKSNRKKKNF